MQCHFLKVYNVGPAIHRVKNPTHGVTHDVVIHETESRNYELEIGLYDRIVMVDGLISPLISLQYGKVKKYSNLIPISVLISFCFRSVDSD